MAGADGLGSTPRKRPIARPPPPPPPILCSYRSASQSRLHNFSFPPPSWGNQRLLRCMNVDSGNEADGGSPSPDRIKTPAAEEFREKRGLVSYSYSPASAAPSPSRLEGPRGRKTPQKGRDREVVKEEEEEDEGEDESLINFKLQMLSHFRQAFDRIKLPPVPEGDKDDPEASTADEVSKPWNLRLRRAACNAPKTENTGQGHQSRCASHLASEKNSVAKYSGRLRSDVPEKKKKRAKFSPVLSREEIEEDFVTMTGSKPPRRPKRRAKNVARLLDMIYPGFSLTEIMEDTYKIP